MTKQWWLINHFFHGYEFHWWLILLTPIKLYKKKITQRTSLVRKTRCPWFLAFSIACTFKLHAFFFNLPVRYLRLPFLFASFFFFIWSLILLVAFSFAEVLHKQDYTIFLFIQWLCKLFSCQFCMALWTTPTTFNSIRKQCYS